MERKPGATEERRPAGVTFRSVVLGLAFVAGLAFFIPYLSDVKNGADLGLGPITTASILALVIVLGPINGLLVWLYRARSLTRQEILTVYSMVAVTAAISTVGYATFVTVMATASQYFASSGNRWEILIQPHIPVWLQLNNPQAIRWLWEGIPEKQAVPWGVWRQPLVAWGAIALCIYVGSFCLVALVRRDWIEGQRLVFPLAQIPLETVGYRGIPGTALLRHPVFWAGFGLAFLHGMMGLLNTYYPAFPYHNMQWPIGRSFNQNVMPWGVLNRLQFNLSWSSIGIMCLLPVEVSLSLWFFHVWYYMEVVALAAFGFTGEAGSRYAFNPGVFFSFQTGGALVGFGALILWQSRRAIAASVRAWWDPVWREHDPLELVKPRYALVGLLVSTAVLCLIANAAGAQVHRLLILLFMFYMTAISLTRVIAAAGTNHVECGPQVRYLLDHGLGTMGVRPGSYVLMNQMDAVFMTEFKVSFMHYAANDMKVFHASRLRGTSVVLSLAAAVVLMVALGGMGRVWSGYHRGIGTLSSWTYDSVPRWEWGDMVDQLQNPGQPDAMGIASMLSGALAAGILALLQTHVSWWRLSPVGFLLQGGWGINALIWANALVGWALVNAIYQFGGLRLYAKLRPSFFGLFLGGTIATLVSSAVLLITGGPGGGGG
ncbi:MAG: hypothetical protein MUQ26_08965 [Armatimonadetes bacterium]|nr:hypothetical protein [Armatimonadota bacterium]